MFSSALPSPPFSPLLQIFVVGFSYSSDSDKLRESDLFLSSEECRVICNTIVKRKEKVRHVWSILKLDASAESLTALSKDDNVGKNRGESVMNYGINPLQSRGGTTAGVEGTEQKAERKAGR